MNSTKKIFVFKHVVYVLLFLFLYVLQSTPDLFAVRGIKPLIVAPAAIALAMHEGEFVGGIYGAFAGLLCDVSSTSLFGYNGFFIAMFCIISGLLVLYLLRCNLLGCMLFVGAALLVRGSVEFLFAYGMWGYEDVWQLYVYYMLPGILYSLLITPLLYRVFHLLYWRFDAALHP